MTQSELNDDDESPIMGKLAAPPPVVPDDHESDDERAGNRGGMFQGRASVLCILFLVTGALGIPLLWASPNFSNRERIFWTFAVLLYTILLFVALGGVMWWAYHRLIGTRGF